MNIEGGYYPGPGSKVNTIHSWFDYGDDKLIRAGWGVYFFGLYVIFKWRKWDWAKAKEIPDGI